MPGSWAIRGHGGRLRCGARTVATLGKWSADQQENGRFRLIVDSTKRDPYWWDNHDPDRLVIELTLAKTDQRFRAALVSAEPFVAEIWSTDAEE